MAVWPEIAVVNESTVVDNTLAWRITWALQYQLYYHFSPAWKIWAKVTYVAKGAEPPSNAWILHLLDSADIEGALGYHDEDGTEKPYARVFCKTAEEDGIAPSEVASHEVLEMLADPYIFTTALDEAHNRLYAFEMCDACQGNSYGVGAAGNQLAVADFLLPRYFDQNTRKTSITNFRKTLKGPFALGSEGYYSYIDLTNYSAGWQQTLGHNYKGKPPVDHDDRFDRRGQTEILDTQ